jgi:hypothetical protein
MDAASSTVWKNCVTAPDTPAGFTLKTAVTADGANPGGHETMLECWEAGAMPHWHSAECLHAIRLALVLVLVAVDGN